MSTGDFAAELQASVQDHLALIASAAAAAKARIGEGITKVRPAAAPKADPELRSDVPQASPARSAVVNFDAPEPDFDPAFAGAFDAPVGEADAFAEEPAPVPPASFDDLSVEGVDDEGIPMWEDPA